jgi:predicted metal-binding protein
MKKIMIIGCGAYMDSGYGCPGEWRCLKAAALGDGKITEESQVVAFVKCTCPGRSTASNVGCAIKSTGIDPDEIYLSSCMVNAKPACPYATAEEMATFIEKKTGKSVKLGTHEYH